MEKVPIQLRLENITWQLIITKPLSAWLEITGQSFATLVSRKLFFSVKMANRTVKDAHSIKGTNPQYLIEKIIRTRIYECRYWKEECFALSGKNLPHIMSFTE